MTGIRGFLSALRRKVQRRLALPRDFEEHLYRVLVRKGDVVFDIGANVGSVALYLSRLAGPQGKIYAFEPVWPVYEMLCANARFVFGAHAPIIPLPTGFSDSDGTKTLQVPDGKFAFASLAAAANWSKAVGDARLVTYVCSFMTLDGFLEERKPAWPDFLKIDVEGAELLVLRGASRFLAEDRRPLILMEVFAPWERAFGYSPWDVLSLLKNRGYDFQFVCPKGLKAHVPSEARPFPPEYEEGYNIIAHVPGLHDDRIRALERFRYDPSRKAFPMEAPPVPNRLD